MEKVAILTDSTVCLPEELRSELQVTVVPQVLIWGEETFRDGVDISPEEFYRKLSTAKVMPSTSQVSPMTMKAAYEELFKSHKDILGIFVSSQLSGTMQSVTQAREMLPDKAEHISIVDSYSTSMGMGLHIIQAARAASSGASLAECTRIAEEARSHTKVYFVVDTLEFLHRGGRIGGAQAFLGSALNIKPLLELRDGRIESVEKVRTKRKAIDRMVEKICQFSAGKSPIRLVVLHANDEEDAQYAYRRALQHLTPVETFFTSVSPVIGTHAGPGTVGLAVMAGM